MVDASVVVVGGGIGGLTTAIALRRANIDAVVVEQAPELHEIGAGVALWPAAINVLTELGLGERLRALAGEYEIGGVRSHDGSWLLRYSFAELVGALG